jgi:hypothetical protein
MLQRFLTLFRPPKPPTNWPKYACEQGWAPKADDLTYPFHAPPQWQYKASQAVGGLFFFWLMLRWKEDAAHEIFVRSTITHMYLEGCFIWRVLYCLKLLISSLRLKAIISFSFMKFYNCI